MVLDLMAFSFKPIVKEPFECTYSINSNVEETKKISMMTKKAIIESNGQKMSDAHWWKLVIQTIEHKVNVRK